MQREPFKHFSVSNNEVLDTKLLTMTNTHSTGLHADFPDSAPLPALSNDIAAGWEGRNCTTKICCHVRLHGKTNSGSHPVGTTWPETEPNFAYDSLKHWSHLTEVQQFWTPISLTQWWNSKSGRMTPTAQKQFWMIINTYLFKFSSNPLSSYILCKEEPVGGSLLFQEHWSKGNILLRPV